MNGPGVYNQAQIDRVCSENPCLPRTAGVCFVGAGALTYVPLPVLIYNNASAAWIAAASVPYLIVGIGCAGLGVALLYGAATTDTAHRCMGAVRGVFGRMCPGSQSRGAEECQAIL